MAEEKDKGDVKATKSEDTLKPDNQIGDNAKKDSADALRPESQSKAIKKAKEDKD